MTIVGMLRVKNEARWIERSISSILPICDRVVVLNDHSTDTTKDICESLSRVEVFDSPFVGLNEARDKNYLLDRALVYKPDWIIAIDGDEMLEPGKLEGLRNSMNTPLTCLSLRVNYLWDREDQVRTDGVYGDFHRESVFRPSGARFSAIGKGPNFHCGNVPWEDRQKRRVMDIALLHFGYMHREDRERKFAWYNQVDPKNLVEDGYRHMVIGDLFPADSKFAHAGPLRLKELNEMSYVRCGP